LRHNQKAAVSRMNLQLYALRLDSLRPMRIS
jgi:hypothetical protein